MSELEIAPEIREYRYLKDPATITKLLKVMLWIFLIVTIFSMISDYMQLNLLNRETFTEAEADANDIRQQISGILNLIAFFSTSIIFLLWLYRANSNCHGFGVQFMDFTPGWSVGWYFIPCANLFKPFQVMREIWMVSSDPVNWRFVNTCPLLRWWWALWIISNFSSQYSFRLSMKAQTIESLKFSTAVSIACAVIDILSFYAAISVISAIYRKQEQLVRSTQTITAG